MRVCSKTKHLKVRIHTLLVQRMAANLPIAEATQFVETDVLSFVIRVTLQFSALAMQCTDFLTK